MLEYSLAYIFDEKDQERAQAFQQYLDELNVKLEKQGYRINAIEVTPKNIKDIIKTTSINGVTYFADGISNDSAKSVLENLIQTQNSIEVYPTYQKDLKDKKQEDLNKEQREYIEALSDSVNYCPIVPGTNENEFKTFVNVIDLGVQAHCNFKAGVEQTADEKISHLVETVKEQTAEKHEYTSGHVSRVSNYVEQIGKTMGLSQEELRELKLSAVLHDIGKLGIVDNILAKPADLTYVERQKMGYHASLGTEMLHFLKEVDSKGLGEKLTDKVIEGVDQHHLHYNGRDKKENAPEYDDINLYARIIAVADSFDAMTSQRAYNNPKDVLRAVEDLWGNRGKQFDPKIADIMIMMIAKEMSNRDYNLADFWSENSRDSEGKEIKEFLNGHQKEIDAIDVDFGFKGIDKEGHFILEQDSYSKETAKTGLENDLKYGKERFKKANPEIAKNLSEEELDKMMSYKLNVDGKRFQDGLARATQAKQIPRMKSPEDVRDKTKKEKARTAEVADATKEIKESIKTNENVKIKRRGSRRKINKKRAVKI